MEEKEQKKGKRKKEMKWGKERGEKKSAKERMKKTERGFVWEIFWIKFSSDGFPKNGFSLSWFVLKRRESPLVILSLGYPLSKNYKLLSKESCYRNGASKALFV